MPDNVNNDLPVSSDAQNTSSPDGTKNKAFTNKEYSWSVEIPNPAEKFNMPGATPEELRQHALDLWTKTKRGKMRDNRGAVANFEIGTENGLPHIHIICVAKSRVEGNTVLKTFPGCHIAPTKNSAKSQLDYLNKEGKFSNKDEQTVLKALHQGSIGLRDCASYVNGKKQRTLAGTLEEIDNRLNAGALPSELYAESARFSQQSSAIERTFYARREKEIPAERDVTVIYHCGPAGSGKSYTRLLYEKERPNDIYVPAREGHMWDGYLCQPILFLDEFRAASMRWDFFLSLLDNYRLQLPARYVNKQAAWTLVHITSTVPLESLYVNKTGALPASHMLDLSEEELLQAKADRHDNFAQLMRRIDKVVYHFIDPLFDGAQKYRTVEISGRAYKNIEQLERFAEQQLKKHLQQSQPQLFDGYDHCSLDDLLSEQEKELKALEAMASVDGLSALDINDCDAWVSSILGGGVQ